MNAKETKMRVTNAFRAMKVLGISEAKVKPVLKNLLKLFDKNWEPIEAESYRSLVDAIFDSEDAQASVEVSPKKTVNYDEAGQSMNITNSQAEQQSMNIVTTQNEDEMEEEHETEALARPLKRVRLKYRDGQSSSPLIKPKDEPCELQEVNNRSQQPVSSKSLIVQEGGNNSKPSDANRSEQNTSTEPKSSTHPMRLRDRGNRSVSPNDPSKGKRPLSESSSRASHIEGPRVEPSTALSPKKKSSATPLIKIKDEPITDDMPLLEAPLAVIRPDLSNGGDSSSRDGTVGGDSLPEPLRHSASEPETNEQRNNGLVTVVDENASKIEVASSPFGEVKISFSCDAALQRPGFQTPILEAVLKAVEEKCLKSYKILDPNFSVMNIMKDMCQSFLELGSEPNTEPPKTIDVTPALDLMKKNSANRNSNVGVLFPVTSPIPLHCDGIDDGSQPNKINGGDRIGTNGEEQRNNMSLVVVQQAEVVTPVHDADDVAKGQEKVLIPLVNEFDDSLPPPFYYISQNAIFKNAKVNFSLACIGDSFCTTCFGDCLSPAANCACATGGGFSYTKDGLVKEEILNECISMKCDLKKRVQFFCKGCPLERSRSVDGVESCKGHFARKFIKECWLKCDCNKQCGNRVVQRGITRNLQVFMTPEGKGWGLRTLEHIPKGAFVCEYVGEVLTMAEVYNRDLRSPKREKGSCPVLLDAGWSGEEEVKEEKALCLDATSYGNVARFINHRCYDSNLAEIPVKVEIPDRHYYHVAFFTRREVKVMEELTWVSWMACLRDFDSQYSMIHERDDFVKLLIANKCQLINNGRRIGVEFDERGEIETKW